MCKKISCVYCIKDSKGVVVYVGSAKDFRNRVNTHKSDLKRHVHSTSKLQALYDSGEEFTFEILEECRQKDLYIKEKEYSELYKDTILNSNVSRGDVTKKKIRRGKEAMALKEKLSCIDKLTASNVMWLYKNNLLTYREIGEIFGFTFNYVNNIINSTWSNIKPVKPEWIIDGIKLTKTTEVNKVLHHRHKWDSVTHEALNNYIYRIKLESKKENYEFYYIDINLLKVKADVESYFRYMNKLLSRLGV